jgi:hypothetical protein
VGHVDEAMDDEDENLEIGRKALSVIFLTWPIFV